MSGVGRLIRPLAFAMLAVMTMASERAGAQDSRLASAPVSPASDAAPAVAPSRVHEETDAPQEPQDPSAERPPAAPLPPFVPPLTDADRAAAFPDVGVHALGDNAIRSFVLLDQFEWHQQDQALGWNARGWVGRDRDRVWFRSEGERGLASVESISLHGLYGRAFSRWWDVVVGMRQDFRPGPSQTWAAVGVQGLAPYWFDVEATAYVGASGRTHARVDLEYDLLLTNWMMLQPTVEVELHGKADPRRGIGAGVSSTNMGVRLRYEVRRELAPYLGFTWHKRYGGTAEAARTRGDAESGAELVLGLRTWF